MAMWPTIEFMPLALEQGAVGAVVGDDEQAR